MTRTNIVYAEFGQPEVKPYKAGVTATKLSRHGKFKVYTNLSKLNNQEFFYEMLRSAVVLEKEVAILRTLDS